MKLADSDKALLKTWNFPESDFPQIEDALGVTVCIMNGKRISRKKAIELLGQKTYLSGIARSAFHWTSCRLDADGNEILFDSSKLFK